MKLTFEEFMKVMLGTDKDAKDILYDYYSYGYKERERQKDKSRRQYLKRKGKEQKSILKVDEV
jgi:hypothetical protein